MEYAAQYLNIGEALHYISFEAFAYLAVVLVMLWVGKFVNDLLTPYNINRQLLEYDNKALAVSYAGYLLAQAIIILGVMSGPEHSLIRDLFLTVVWSAVGIVLLNLSRVINDKLVLYRFNNVKEIIDDKNVGTGAVQFGGYVGVAFVIRAIVAGESVGLVHDVIGTVVFYVAAQLLFVLFGVVYQVITSYDVHEEIEKDNPAVGTAFGMTLTAMGIMLGHIIVRTDSLPALGTWFVNCTFLLLVVRFLIDRLILPGHKLNDELARDRNWGVALIEGAGALATAFLVNASFA